MIGNDVAELFLELGQQFLDCEVQNEEGLIVKTGTGNGVHAPVVRPEEEHEPEGG